MSRTAFFLFAAVCAMVLFSTSSVPAGAGPAWTAYETWTAKFTITVTYQSSIEGGRSSMFHKIEGNGTLDNKVITEDANGPVHVSWTGEGCHLSGEVDELLNQNIKDGTRHYERKGSSQSGHDCPVIFLDTHANTYSVVLPFAHVAIEEKTLVTTDGQIAQKDESQGYAYLGIPSINDPCCSHLPLPAAGTPLQHTRTVTSDLANTNAMLFFFEDNTAAQRSVTAVITWEFRPRGAVDVEAVMEPESGYDDWAPEAPSANYDPSPLAVNVRIHKKGDPNTSPHQTARFKFELVDTSQEPGYCLNAPDQPDPHFSSTPADEPFDLEIGAKDNPALKISDKGQRAETKDGLTDATVLINPADWGGYTRLKVTAILKDGTEVVAHLKADDSKRELRIPRDDNDNHIADTWEKALGIFDRKLPADWNEADDPAKQLAVGDGISLYEKYRGFEFDGRHESLQPTKKYLFLFDADGLYKTVFALPETAGLDFASLSMLEVRLITDDEWTGWGEASEGHRIVNFNHRTGHADDQHGVHLKVSGPLPHGFSGLAWPDGPDPDVFGPPRVTLRVDIDVNRIIEIIQQLVDKVSCTLPRPPGPLQPTYPHPANPRIIACDADTIADAYRVKHEQELWEGFCKLLAKVVTHELAHAVGVRHHEATEDGDHQCVMRYFKYGECSVDPADPVQLKCRSPWPSKLVGPDRHSHAGTGCFQQIIVNDAK